MSDKAEGARWRTLSELLPNVNGRVSETRQTHQPGRVRLRQRHRTRPFGDLPVDRRAVQRLRRARLPVAVGARSRRRSTTRGPRRTTSRRRELMCAQRARLRDPRRRQPVRAGARGVGPRRCRAGAAGDRPHASPAGARSEAERHHRRHRRAARRSAARRADASATTDAVNEFEKAKLPLARVIGLPLGQAFALDPDLPNLPVSDISIEAAVVAAYATRPDYQAALERVAAAEADPPLGRRRGAAVGAGRRRLRRHRPDAVGQSRPPSP